MGIEIVEADFTNAGHASAIVALIDGYARGSGGQGAPLSELAKERMIPGLAAHPSALVLLACVDGEPMGVAVCVWSFSTFAGKPSVNVHDLAVRADARGRGLGTRLLEDVERRARERDCCKITLEVNDVNDGAKRLYASFGFGSFESPTWFVTKPLADPTDR